jgi:hypothetical protein
MYPCLWQAAPRTRWYSAVGLRDLGDSFLEVEVAELGRRIGTTDLERDYPGRIKPAPKRRRR